MFKNRSWIVGLVFLAWLLLPLEGTPVIAVTEFEGTHHGAMMHLKLRVTAVADQAEQTASVVDVSLFEWGILTDVSQVQAGLVTFNIGNDGQVPHALKITGNGISEETEVFASGQARVLQATLAPGEYDLWCPVPGHRGLGMETGFSVAGAGTSLERTLDKNANNLIDDDEILSAIGLWISGAPVPGVGQAVSDIQMLALIRLWATGQPIQ